MRGCGQPWGCKWNFIFSIFSLDKRKYIGMEWGTNRFNDNVKISAWGYSLNAAIKNPNPLAQSTSCTSPDWKVQLVGPFHTLTNLGYCISKFIIFFQQSLTYIFKDNAKMYPKVICAASSSVLFKFWTFSTIYITNAITDKYISSMTSYTCLKSYQTVRNKFSYKYLSYNFKIDIQEINYRVVDFNLFVIYCLWILMHMI